jgi:hypothetical protein
MKNSTNIKRRLKEQRDLNSKRVQDQWGQVLQLVVNLRKLWLSKRRQSAILDLQKRDSDH